MKLTKKIAIAAMVIATTTIGVTAFLAYNQHKKLSVAQNRIERLEKINYAKNKKDCLAELKEQKYTLKHVEQPQEKCGEKVGKVKEVKQEVKQEAKQEAKQVEKETKKTGWFSGWFSKK